MLITQENIGGTLDSVVVLEEGGTRRRKKTHTLIARVQREVE